MDDGQTIVAVFLAIVAGAVLFVWALRHEDNARIAHGDHRIVMLGYRTWTGWAAGIALALVIWFLLLRS